MSLVPLYGFVEGDTMGVLVLAADDMRIETVIANLSQSASPRVAVDTSAWDLVVDGRVVDREHTVDGAKLVPLQRVDLRRRRPPEAAR